MFTQHYNYTTILQGQTLHHSSLLLTNSQYPYLPSSIKMLAFIEEECNIISSSHPEMDQREDQIQKRLMNDKKQFLKRTLQFVSSVSLFCIFVWFSSGFSIHPQSFNAYFSTCFRSMFTHTLQRKYMFLICNGILAFLAKNMRSDNSDHFELHASNYNLSETKAPVSDDDMVVVPPLGSFESPEKVPLMDHEEVEWHCTEEVSSEAEEQEEGTLCAQNEASNIAEEEEIKHKGIDDEKGTELSEVNKVAQDDDGDVDDIDIDDDDDEVEETTMTTNELELANKEELNRKFEEFIRKMKEEMRIEAQRQLIAV